MMKYWNEWCPVFLGGIALIIFVFVLSMIYKMLSQI